MAANKFKVGDKVRVKAGLTDEYYGSLYCNEEMVYMFNDILTISEIKCGDRYAVQENQWHWNDDMLESVTGYKNILREAEAIHSGMKSAIEKQICNEMMKIIDYKYNSGTGETYIKWADKTETRVRPENGTEPNQYVGFVTAYAKKAAGNTSRINSLFDKWAIKKPIKDKIAEEKRIAEETETKRILEKRKAKREKWLIRKEALRIKREYEARNVAHEKYGIPMNETINS